MVVTPVYEDRAASSRLFQELARLYGDRVFCVVVDDGSVSLPVDLAALTAAGLEGTVIRLRRNVGHQSAIAVGLNYVSEHFADYDAVIVMDSDGEDAPDGIEQLLTHIDDDNADVVVAERGRRSESIWFRTFYLVYRLLFKLMTGRTITFGNFMAIKPAALSRLVSMQEIWLHVAGSILTSKLRITHCPLDRGERYAGSSKMNFVGLALHGFKGLMIFAEDVLVRVGVACTLVAFLSVLAGITAVTLKVIGIATPGWFSVAIGILFLVFLQTGALTLMTLMMTGVAKGGLIATNDYKLYIKQVEHAT